MALEDVLTLDEARKAVAAGPNDDAILESWVTAISRRMDMADMCGPIRQRTVTNELHPGGNFEIQLRHWPVTAVSAVDEDQGTRIVSITARTFGTAPTDGYAAEPWHTDTAPYSGRLSRWSGTVETAWWGGPLAVRVSYTAGRFASVTAVTPTFKRAAVLFLKHVWTSHQVGTRKVGEFDVPASNYPALMVPRAVKDALGVEMHRAGLA